MPHLQAPADRHVQLGQRAKGAVVKLCNHPTLLVWLLESEVGNMVAYSRCGIMQQGRLASRCSSGAGRSLPSSLHVQGAGTLWLLWQAP